MKKYILATILIISAGLVLTTAAVSAQGLKGASGVFEDVGKKAGADNYKNPEDVIGIGIGAAITLVGMIFLILMVYAGYLWMTARGEQEQVDKAQKIITAALIGFFIVASAYAITTFVSGKLGGGGSTSNEGGGQVAAKGCVIDFVELTQYCDQYTTGDQENMCNQAETGIVKGCEWSTILPSGCIPKEDVVANYCGKVKKEDCEQIVTGCKWVK
ncbi:MAG: hypothetical protein HY569_02660 [Candidatus Magasanikbacteria bacterium]|nr:hypothetical protein [Candidatus Magasanikbacteria bacterium]